MLTALVNGMLEEVVLPELGPPPDDYQIPMAVYLIGALAIAIVVRIAIVFVQQILYNTRQFTDYVDHLVVPGLVVVVCAAAIGAITEAGKAGALDAVTGHHQLERDVEQQVVGELEELYGITFDEYPSIPLYEGESTADEVVLPDGGRERCYFTVVDGRYVVTCGGDFEAEGEPLLPVSDR